jgi:putative oxidoreductase
VTFLRSPGVQLVLRLLLGGYFVYASLDKILAPAAFARIVYQWQVAGPVPSNLVAVTLPWVEFLAGTLLVVGAWRREAALVIALLLVVFLSAATSVLARGIDVENCGCTSLAKTEATTSAWPPAWTRGVGWFLLTRNTLLLGAALLVASTPPRREVRPVPDGDRAAA